MKLATIRRIIACAWLVGCSSGGADDEVKKSGTEAHRERRQVVVLIDGLGLFLGLLALFLLEPLLRLALGLVAVILFVPALVVGSLALIVTIIGIPFAWVLAIVIGIWVLYRIVRGWLALIDRKPIAA